MEEDPTMIWEVAEGTRIPRGLRLVEHLDAPQGIHKFTLQPSISMPFSGKPTMLVFLFGAYIDLNASTKLVFAPISALVWESRGEQASEGQRSEKVTGLEEQ